MLKVNADFLTKDQVIYDLVIVGAGPAGIASAIYGKRANLNLAIIEGNTPGGKIVKTNIVENYPGFKTITGPELGLEMYNHLLAFEPVVFYNNLIKIDHLNDTFILYLDNKTTVFSKTVIYATGMEERKLGIEKEDYFYGKGISYCAICDAALYKGKTVGVVGGGNSAIQEAIYLSSIAKTVHLIHRREVFRSDALLVEKLKKISNVVFHLNATVKQLIGQEKLQTVKLASTVDKSESEIAIDCLFPYIGFESNNKPVLDLKLNLDQNGFILGDENMQTNIKGFYVAGDCRSKSFRQIVTAISDGVTAVLKVRDDI